MAQPAAPYQFFPDLPAELYEALKADIATRGQRHPIEVDERGQIIEGHQRDRICAELGIKPKVVVLRGLSETEKIEHALKVNLLRRHLGAMGWAEGFRRLAELEGLRLGSGKGSPAPKAATIAALARRLGVKPRTARHRLHVAEALAPHPDLAAMVEAGEMEAKRAVTLAREREAVARPEPPLEAIPSSADLRLGDFRKVLSGLETASVDLIYTDPPYLGSTMGIYADLGEFAVRVLKPEGLLLAEAGTMFLPEAIQLLEQQLGYRWCIGLVLPGKRARVHARRVINGWRPILVFARDPGYHGRWLYDLCTVQDPPDKLWHPWQKAVGPARYYVEALTDPGDLVVDPFVGSGTTAVVAVELGRRFVGSDIDAKALKGARIRVAAAARGGK